jgi:hypothetical protein
VNDVPEDLAGVLRVCPDVVYGFAADLEGNVIAEAGDRGRLPYAGIVDVSLRRESIAAWFEEIKERQARDPRLVPKLYAQGEVQAVIGSPADGVLLVLFATMPQDVYAASPKARVAWVSAHRATVWGAVTSSWSRST